MTAEKAKEIIEKERASLNAKMVDYNRCLNKAEMDNCKDLLNAYDMAVEALGTVHNRTGDLISRNAVIEIIDNAIQSTSDYLQHNAQIEIRFAVEELPTVEVKPTGYWRKSHGIFFCSECNNGYKDQPTLMGQPMFEYCPMCGSKMKKNGASRSNDGVKGGIE